MGNMEYKKFYRIMISIFCAIVIVIGLPALMRQSKMLEKYRVAWIHPVTKEKHYGEWSEDRNMIEAWVIEGERTHPELKHYVENKRDAVKQCNQPDPKGREGYRGVSSTFGRVICKTASFVVHRLLLSGKG